MSSGTQRLHPDTAEPARSDAARPPRAVAPRHARNILAREALALLLAAALEVTLVALLWSHTISLPIVLAGHLVTVLLSALVLLRGRDGQDDLAFTWLVLLLVAVAGPVGAVPLLTALPFARLKPIDAVEAWYDRLAFAGQPSQVSVIHERIVSGRVQRLHEQLPADFLAVIRSGGLEECQRALGLIARHFHPDYTPVLEAALRSREPVVRVQAAAVVARVREDLKAKVAALCAEGPRSRAQALTDAGELTSLQACTLLSKPHRDQCAEAARRFLLQGLPGDHDVARVLPIGRDAHRALEDFLISERRFNDLRVLRRVRAVAAHSGRVVRRRRLSKVTAEAAA